MHDFRPAQAHGPLEELAAGLFVVRGSFRTAPLLSIGRNMLVVRQGAELVLFNAIRLTSDGEKALAKLGRVKHIVRLGCFHGSDDPYYRERYQAEIWAPAGLMPATRVLSDGDPGPLEVGEMFVFSVVEGGEAAALLPSPEGTTLVTCDSIQNWRTARGCSFLGRLTLRMMGFFEPAKIGPIWAKKVTGGNPAKLRPEFERLLQKEFRHLVSAHGEPMIDGAKTAIRRSVDAMFARNC